MLGIFDSGSGGLTVLKAIRTYLPDLRTVYLGDNARTPYGNRNRETVTQYTKECCTYLFERGCRLIVLACNTASADTLRILQQEWLPSLRKQRGDETFNILGVIRPLVEEAAELTRSGRIGVLGTRSTVASGAYIHELKKLRSDAKVVQQACPLLVPLVEEGWIEKPETRRILRSYLYPLKSHNPDVLILGCTHYEALHGVFQRKMGKRCRVLHSPPIIARKLADYLARHPEYSEALPRTGGVTILTTGDAGHFREVGGRFYGGEIGDVEHVELSYHFAF